MGRPSKFSGGDVLGSERQHGSPIGDLAFEIETFNLVNAVVAMADNSTNGAQGRLFLGNLSAGLYMIAGIVTDLTVLAGTGGIADTAALVGSIGTAAAANSDATLTGSEANLIASAALTLSAGAAVAKLQSAGAVFLDATKTDVPVYLNFAVPDAGSTGNDTLILNGRVRVVLANLGDN